jgi:predicted nucleic acid-binding protein
MSRIYWDTMLFVYWLEENPTFGKRVNAIWSRMQERNDQLITGTLALGEVLAGAYRRGIERQRIQDLRTAFEGAVSEIVPFTSEAADLFAQIKGSWKIPSADAIHLACAATANTDLFLTNDRNLVGRVIPGIQFIASMETQIL